MTMSTDAIEKTNCLTFEVEEHFHVSAFDSPVRRRHWDQFQSRVGRNTEKVLTILAERGIRATFFALGWVAERYPHLIKAIVQDGHEVASHGYAHELITAQTPEQFREDVRRSKGILEGIIGEAVLGYRAPSYLIDPETPWAAAILVEEGYVYDSSISPTPAEYYSRSRASRFTLSLNTTSGPLWLIPPSALQVARLRITLAGGKALRLLPYWIFKQMFWKAAAVDQPVVMHLNSWELDPDQPLMNGPRFTQFQHYANLDKVEKRLTLLLQDFPFAPIRKLLPLIGWACLARQSLISSLTGSICS